jgi:hypothetical protein
METVMNGYPQYDKDIPRSEITQRWQRASGLISDKVWFQTHPRLVLDEGKVVFTAQDYGYLMEALGKTGATAGHQEISISFYAFEQYAFTLGYSVPSSTAGQATDSRA